MDKPPSAHRNRRKPRTRPKKIRSTFRWNEHRKRMREMYSGVCVLCVLTHPDQRPNRSREVHHIIPLSLDAAFAYVDSNTVPLCRDCHERVTEMERAGQNAEARAVFTNWQERMKGTNYVQDVH